MPRRIAVTGATGFVGGYIAEYLEKQGHTVIRYGRKDVPLVLKWDISQGTLPTPMEVDAVVHCAASVDDWTRYVPAYAANVVGTRNVLASFSSAKVFVYISSASVYDAFSRKKIITENDCVTGKFLNAYSKTKYLGEQELIASEIKSRVILRPHIIYGPGDTTVGPRIRNAIRNNRFPVIGAGQNHISFTHVENVAQAVSRAITAAPEGVHAYNITDEHPYTFMDALEKVKLLNTMNFKIIKIPRGFALILGAILEVVFRITGRKKSPRISRYIVDQMSSDHIFSIEKAQRELAYRPIRTIEKDFIL